MIEIEKQLYRDSKEYRSLRQEHLYHNSVFLDCKWYRKLYGGEWRLLKFGKDTPYIKLFSVWTKINRTDDGRDCWDGYYKVIETENYPETGVVTHWQVFKQFLKNIFTK